MPSGKKPSRARSFSARLCWNAWPPGPKRMLVENRAGSERALCLLILIEIAIFAFTGPNFFSTVNAFEIVRLGVELGLLALALTPVIVTGGIDLSVGSMMGLCAVVFGYLWRDAHFSVLA